MEEIELEDRSQLPDVVYHVVPKHVFSACVNDQGDYDGRSRPDWGKSAPYIHTTTDLETLKNRVSGNWEQLPADFSFLLLRIETQKLHPDSKITYADYGTIRYYHIWDALPFDSFQTSPVTRNADGEFEL